jgi:polysaccharide export outer membrane protein
MSRRWRVGLFALLLFSAGACAAQQANVSYADFARDDPRTRPYVIGVSDVVRVTVWKDPSLSTEMAVRPDGMITLPLVGEIEAAGRTTGDVRQELTRRLAAYLKDAIVTVAVVEVNSYRFTVAGNVEKPGMFTPRYFVTVSEAVSLAGGPNRYASQTDLVVIRPRKNQPPERIPINYEKILSGERPDADIVILAGDTVLIP